jgi:hypothetical protein
MYGLVNKAIQDMVIKSHGEDAWNGIRKEAGLDDERLVSLKNYPDSLTFRLVGAACHQLGAEANDILESFGEYWVLYTAEEGYGDMLDFTGSTLPEFLNNLDLLHLRVKNLMPELRPPAFSCENETENSVDLIYESSRDGLSAMVIGLLTGLGKRFDKDLKVEQTAFKKDGNGPDRFFIQW